MSGRKSKPYSRNRTKPVHDWTEVVDVPFTGGPKLPAKMPNGLAWPARTRRWWESVSSMPHCSIWRASDWEFAFDTAFIAGLLHGHGGTGYATELRNREKVLGTTMDFRRALRIRYVDDDDQSPGESATVTALDAYRDL
ncbi:MAG: hypothetical protein QM747_18280 [Nocardioides sp.]